MRKKEVAELKAKSIKELKKKAQVLREEIAKEKVEFEVNRPKDTNTTFKKRKRLARVLTIIREKELFEK